MTKDGDELTRVGSEWKSELSSFIEVGSGLASENSGLVPFLSKSY
jgi:hypothetical protein